MSGIGRRNGERGSILLLVMWVAAALAMIALSVSLSVRTELAATQYRLEAEQGRFLAHGGVEQSLFVIRNQGVTDAEGRRLYSPGQTRIDFAFSTGTARVEIVPESGKLNINTVTRQQLRALLLAAGLTEASADDSAAAIFSWRTERGVVIERPEDLLAAPGVTLDLFYGWIEREQAGHLVSRGGLGRFLSPHGALGPVDLNYAPYEVLMTVPGMEAQIASAIVDGRRAGPYESFQDLPVQLPLQSASHVSLQTPLDVFSLVATGYPARSGAHATVRALVRREPLTGQIKLLRWDEAADSTAALDMTDTGT